MLLNTFPKLIEKILCRCGVIQDLQKILNNPTRDSMSRKKIPIPGLFLADFCLSYPNKLGNLKIRRFYLNYMVLP